MTISRNGSHVCSTEKRSAPPRSLVPCPLRRAAPPCPTGQARNRQGGLEGFPQRFQGTKKKGRQSFVVMFLRPRQHFTTISLRLGTYAAGKQPPLIALAPSRGGAKKKRHPLNGKASVHVRSHHKYCIICLVSYVLYFSWRWCERRSAHSLEITRRHSYASTSCSHIVLTTSFVRPSVARRLLLAPSGSYTSASEFVCQSCSCCTPACGDE